MSLNCPYCEHEIDDPDEKYETCRTYEHECPNCEKTFVFEVEYVRYYNAEKADCLNGGKHDYQMTRTIPKRYSRMKCTMCQDEKPLDADVLQKIIDEETNP